MAPTLVIPTRDSQVLGDDSIETTSARRTSQLRPTSWINYQNERQRSQELKRARKEEDAGQKQGKDIKSETPMIEWTSAFFKKIFRRDKATHAGGEGYEGC